MNKDIVMKYRCIENGLQIANWKMNELCLMRSGDEVNMYYTY